MHRNSAEQIVDLCLSQVFVDRCLNHEAKMFKPCVLPFDDAKHSIAMILGSIGTTQVPMNLNGD